MLRRNIPDFFWLTLIAGLAIGLRLVNIGRDSLWFDEALSYLAATLPAPVILANTVQSSHPPLYYVLLHFWRAWFPDTDTAVRLMSLLWNLLLIPAVYLLAGALFGQRRLALLAALLVAVSPFHVLYSHELRMYTQFMFLVTAGAWAYWQAWHSNYWRWWALFGFFFLAAVYTHLFAALALGAIGLHALIFRQNQRALVRTLLTIALIGLLFAPWVATIPGQTQSDLGTLRPLTAADSRNPVKPLTSLVFLLFGMSDTFVYSGVILFLTLAIAMIVLMELRKLRREGIPPGFILLVLLILGTLGLPLTIYLIRPFFLPERTMAAASPFLIILLAWTATRRHSPLPYLVALAAVAMLAGSLLYLAGGPVKPPYRDAVAFVAAHRAEGDAVLHTSDGSFLPALRYVSWPDHAVLAGDPDPRRPVAVYELLGGAVWTPAQAAEQSERLWLIVALEHSVEWQQEQATYFANHYTELESHTFGGIRVFLYRLRPANEGET